MFDRNQRFALNAVYYWGSDPFLDSSIDNNNLADETPSQILMNIYNSINEDVKSISFK